MHIFRHLFVCFQTSVYTLGEFQKNRNNSKTAFDTSNSSNTVLLFLKYIRLKNKPNSVRIRSLSCQIFVLPSTGFELTPLIHCSTNRLYLALCPAPKTSPCMIGVRPIIRQSDSPTNALFL